MKNKTDSGTPRSFSETLSLVQRYCAYQERCKQEIKQKFYDLGLPLQHLEETLEVLCEQGYIDEERYARMFARGHFRQNKWGKLKIGQALKHKHIPEAYIRRALEEVDENYEQALVDLLTKKLSKLKGTEDRIKTQNKLHQYALQKGFESSAIFPVIKLLLR